MNQLSERPFLIEVEDLPESVASALEHLVETIHSALDSSRRKACITVPTRKGDVSDDLSRDTIYG